MHLSPAGVTRDFLAPHPPMQMICLVLSLFLALIERQINVVISNVSCFGRSQHCFLRSVSGYVSNSPMRFDDLIPFFSIKLSGANEGWGLLWEVVKLARQGN